MWLPGVISTAHIICGHPGFCFTSPHLQKPSWGPCLFSSYKWLYITRAQWCSHLALVCRDPFSIAIVFLCPYISNLHMYTTLSGLIEFIILKAPHKLIVSVNITAILQFYCCSLRSLPVHCVTFHWANMCRTKFKLQPGALGFPLPVTLVPRVGPLYVFLCQFFGVAKAPILPNASCNRCWVLEPCHI